MPEKSPNQPSQTPDAPQIEVFYPIRDSHLKGHLEGNQYFPQKMRAIRIYVACAVVTDPPDDWQDLRVSRLSNAQVLEMATEMNASHQANRIMKFSEDSEELLAVGARSSMSVPLERFQELWQSDIDGVLRMIHQKVADGPPLPAIEDINAGSVTPISAEAVEEINMYWQNPKKQIEIKLMQEAARIIQSILHEENDRFIRDLSYLWQASFSHKKLDRALLGTYLDPDFQNYIGELYGRQGKFNSEAFTRFYADIQPFYTTPTHQLAQNDVIFRLIKRKIEADVKKADLPMPFGLDYTIEDPSHQYPSTTPTSFSP